MTAGTTRLGILGGKKLFGAKFNVSTFTWIGTGQFVNTGQRMMQNSSMFTKTRNTAGSGIRMISPHRGTSLATDGWSDAASAPVTNLTYSFLGKGVHFIVSGSPSPTSLPFVSWSWRDAKDFCKTISWDGDGTGNRNINHGHSVTPSTFIVRAIDAVGVWALFHASAGNTGYISLHDTNTFVSDSNAWGNTSPTSSVFTVGSTFNASGVKYEAIVFGANNATDLHAGDFTADGSGNASISGIGFEIDAIIYGKISGTGNKFIADRKRGFGSGAATKLILWNETNAEGVPADYSDAGDIITDSDGFDFNGGSAGSQYWFIGLKEGTI